MNDPRPRRLRLCGRLGRGSKQCGFSAKASLIFQFKRSCVQMLKLPDRFGVNATVSEFLADNLDKDTHCETASTTIFQVDARQTAKFAILTTNT